MNYESMSDFEINKAVAEAYQLEQGGFVKQSKTPTDDGYAYHYCDSVGVYSSIGEFCGVKDHCGNPADAWPIIIENEIGINKLKCEPFWIADKAGDYVRSENPLRAAMIVFLMLSKG
ncbi:NinX [Pseudoalteromonas phage XCL1123]|nr:NinX [Pseudoalteromonas phage XCL1123]